MGRWDTARTKEGMRTHAEYDSALGNLFDIFAIPVRVPVNIIVHAQIQRSNTLVLFKLCPNLISDGLGPRNDRQIKVHAKNVCERFGFDQCFVEVPDKTVSNSMCLGLELHTNRNKGCAFQRMGFKGV